MAQSAVAVAIKPDLGWNYKQGRRLALRADHGHTSGKIKTSILQVQQSRGKINSNTIRGSFSTVQAKKENFFVPVGNISIKSLLCHETLFKKYRKTL
jgi:hypothetical protein